MVEPPGTRLAAAVAVVADAADHAEVTARLADAATGLALGAETDALATVAALRHDVLDARAGHERAARRLEAATDISAALAGTTDVDRVFRLVVEHARAVAGARSAELCTVEGEELTVRTAVGEGAGRVEGLVIPLEASIAAPVVRLGRSRRFDRVPAESLARTLLGGRRALATPLIFHGRILGVLVIVDRETGDEPFDADEERTLEAFATFAATALATAQTATDESLRRSIEASEAERRRWARELHDQTLQDLASVRLLLATALDGGDGALEDAVSQAIGLLGDGVDALRSLIGDLRPPALDRFGTEAALRDLVHRTETASGLEITLRCDLAFEQGLEPTRHVDAVESTMYRLVQEALTNVVKHAGARHVDVRLQEAGGRVEVMVADDGAGFDPDAQDGGGLGLMGMRERLALVRGTLEVDARPGRGTTVRASLPVRRRRLQAA